MERLTDAELKKLARTWAKHVDVSPQLNELIAMRAALRDLVEEVGPCQVERGHHTNATGSHRADETTCAACVARKLSTEEKP